MIPIKAVNELLREREMEAWKGLCVAVVIIMVVGGGEGQLSENFYSLSCPNVESIVNQTVFTKFNQTIITIPATLRLFFHDCMVEVRTIF